MRLNLEEQIIIFQLFGQSYAFYFKEVKEFIEPGLLSFISQSPSFFQGIMNHLPGGKIDRG